MLKSSVEIPPTKLVVLLWLRKKLSKLRNLLLGSWRLCLNNPCCVILPETLLFRDHSWNCVCILCTHIHIRVILLCMFVYIFFKQKRGRMSSGNQRGKRILEQMCAHCRRQWRDDEIYCWFKKKMLQIKFCVKTQKVEHNCVWKQALWTKGENSDAWSHFAVFLRYCESVYRGFESHPPPPWSLTVIFPKARPFGNWTEVLRELVSWSFPAYLC
jgi:hypothetical protein